ncbi:D-hexose-6-phosphate mutarotase [Phycisphaera mikurensis]|uniref:Putative glucose-6-phosphate 1-epimerase n=1 Tax=Phycisphaera mikurensis (strain NBRC 102666 / KCTC 22515 / FYK2301M01) TaxID=1142394 RepID=I0IJ95_PHYMF|nr:D-hexose-6-phosphate mutarotase [Phycisphaera mikurensis]MBB6441867.1 glucose-6-phosphate 1-epimerase [Phycisphaera mikurensis]BAM05333.1 putative aldose 1-epimerase [Phycisphaera mikurensis NBRC 102666]
MSFTPPDPAATPRAPGEISAGTDGATGRVTPYGAHVFSWIPAGHDEVLYVSPRAVLDGSKPIRGGIPVCFPWFGAGGSGDATPAHGTVRRDTWEVRERRGDGAAFATRAGGFGISLDASFGDTLTLRVAVTRTADDAAAFELALHSYFAVSEASAVSVTGLAGARGLDSLTGETFEQDTEPIRFAAEYDRVFTGCPGPQTLHDPGLKRKIVITPDNLPSAIVWNPHAAKAGRMSDLGADQYPRFVCIESGRVRQDAVTLRPGETFEASVGIAVEAA